MKRHGNSNMAVLVVIIAVMSTLVFVAVTKRSNTVPANRNKLLEEVMEFDFDNDYPKDPNDVLEKYNEIERLLSGNTIDGFTEADLRVVVEKQRMLIHPELLEINPLEEHIKGYSDKIETLEKNNMRIMQIDMETPRFSDDALSCSIGVKQFWNGHTQVDLVYNLKRDPFDEKWRITGWYVNSQEEAV